MAELIGRFKRDGHRQLLFSHHKLPVAFSFSLFAYKSDRGSISKSCRARGGVRISASRPSVQMSEADHFARSPASPSCGFCKMLADRTGRENKRRSTLSLSPRFNYLIESDGTPAVQPANLPAPLPACLPVYRPTDPSRFAASSTLISLSARRFRPRCV